MEKNMEILKIMEEKMETIRIAWSWFRVVEGWRYGPLILVLA